MRKVEHIALDKGFFDLFICPVDEQFVIEISFFSQTTREIDWVLKPCPIPVSFK
jgi:hypothetical protein